MTAQSSALQTRTRSFWLRATADDRAMVARSRLEVTGGSVPMLGGALSAPLNRAGNAAGSIADAGQRSADTITSLAWPVAVFIVSGPIIVAVLIWC